MCHNKECLIELDAESISISVSRINNYLDFPSEYNKIIENGFYIYEKFYSPKVFNNNMKEIFKSTLN